MKLGILLKNLGPSQLAYYAIKNANNHPSIDTILFYEDYVRPCFPMGFAAMQIYEGYGYDGTVIATSLSTAYKALHFPMTSRKFFYLWDLEWLRLNVKHFRDLHDVYGNPSLKLLARSNSHKDMIEDCWNVKVHAVVDDLNMKQLVEAVE